MIHQTSYIIYTARHYCNLLLLERSAPTHSRYYSIGGKLTPKCHGRLFGWVLKMKRFALSKKREMESETEAELCMKQAHSFLFFFFYHRPDFLQLQLHSTLFSDQSSNSCMDQSFNQQIGFQKPKHSASLKRQMLTARVVL